MNFIISSLNISEKSAYMIKEALSELVLNNSKYATLTKTEKKAILTVIGIPQEKEFSNQNLKWHLSKIYKEFKIESRFHLSCLLLCDVICHFFDPRPDMKHKWERHISKQKKELPQGEA